jgi:hypothetical protein
MLALALPCFVGRGQNTEHCAGEEKTYFQETYNTILTGQIVHWQCRGKFFEVLLIASPVTSMLCGLSFFLIQNWGDACVILFCVSGFVLDLILSVGVAVLLPAVQCSLRVHLPNMFCIRCN